MLEQVSQLARDAGDAIMQVYDGKQPLDVASKKDDSPVTAADIAAHHVIVNGLKAMTPDIPILSEEDPPGWDIRQHWQRYWLVDPLDGTKEFIKRNGEFTVNIALIENGKAVLGVVYAPVLKVMYSAANGKAWKEECGVRKPIQVRDANPPKVVVSRSHYANDDELKEYLQQLGEHQTASIGSSLKFCLVAEGEAQLYPRFGPTNIWDTAAGHAVAAAAGAHVNDWQGKTLDYTPANLSSTRASGYLFSKFLPTAALNLDAAVIPVRRLLYVCTMARLARRDAERAQRLLLPGHIGQ